MDSLVNGSFLVFCTWAHGKRYSQQTISRRYNAQEFRAKQLFYFVFHANMILKSAFAFFLLLGIKVEYLACRQLSLLHLSEHHTLKPSFLDLSSRRFKRGRRCLGTTLALLWPQVVGPVEQGVITESDYNEVPKTVLEHRLDLLREKARQEEEDRLAVREYLMKLTKAQDEFYGFSYGNSLMSDYT